MFILQFLLPYILTTSIYTFQFTDVDGATHSFSQYQGKKILLVNIATQSPRASQLASLQQLHQLYGDSVVVIAFPSNSFGNEPRSNAEIKQFCQQTYGTTFLIAAKGSVSGGGIQPVFAWLASSEENGTADVPTGGDFQKFLINNEGMLIGYFSPKVNPLDNSIQSALTGQ